MDSWVAYRDFRFLWFANFCAFTGQWLQLLSIGWLVKELSAGSGVGGLLVLSASALNTLPGLVVNPLTGVLGDAVLLDDKIEAVRALLSSTDLDCITSIDVTMPDIATVVRHSPCGF